MIPEKKIKKLMSAIADWLRPDNAELKEAIDKTVKEGFFSLEDIKHQIGVLKVSLNENDIKKWYYRNRFPEFGEERKKILFLHAGNLPLVGLQDVIAAVLSNVVYMGKLSRKDPYLLPTFLNSLQRNGLFKDAMWDTDLQTFKNSGAEAMVFSGSGKTVHAVKKKVSELNAVQTGAPELIRSAHFSIAYIEDHDPVTMQQLTEAVFRYGGLGCRSAVIVVAPFSLNFITCEFTDYVESFWFTNPQHEKPPPLLYHRFAYNKAVGIGQLWLDDFLIEETEKKPDQDFVLQWIEGGRKKVVDIANKNRDGLQSVYVQDIGIKLPGLQLETERLAEAQKPPVYWKPDGVDTIRWIVNL